MVILDMQKKRLILEEEKTGREAIDAEAPEGAI